jgi:hypothetical protein
MGRLCYVIDLTKRFRKSISGYRAAGYQPIFTSNDIKHLTKVIETGSPWLNGDRKTLRTQDRNREKPNRVAGIGARKTLAPAAVVYFFVALPPARNRVRPRSEPKLTTIAASASCSG